MERQTAGRRAINRQKLERIEGWAQDINKSEMLVIVEGLRDEEALRCLGVMRVWCLDKRPLYAAAEEISQIYREAALLADLDAEGEKIVRSLRRDLIACGVKVVMKYREWLRVNTGVKQIEELEGYVGNLRVLIYQDGR